MPEEIEVDTEKLHESIREELEKDGGSFLRKIALSTALLAVLAAVAALRAGATVNHALLLRADATQLQSKASDQWAYYQAKGVKAAVQESTRATWLAAGKEPPAAIAEKVERYEKEQEAIREKAVELEKERDAKVKESEHLLHGHHGFANAVALFQVAIALGAVAALTRSRVVWAGSIVVGMGGAVLLAWALL
jgi:NAD-specific glutamate dehydrogenase